MLARQCSTGRYSPAIAAREGDHEPVPYKHNVLAACDLRLTPACVTFCVSTPERGKRRRDRSPSSSSSSSVDSSSGDSSDNSSDSEPDRKHKKHKTKKDKHKKHKTKKDKKKKDKKSKKDTKKKKVIVLDWAVSYVMSSVLSLMPALRPSPSQFAPSSVHDYASL